MMAPGPDFSTNRIVKLFGTRLPVIQAGMVWVSGGKLAAAAANAGALGIIGAGSMKPDLLKHHIEKAKGLTKEPLAVKTWFTGVFRCSLWPSRSAGANL